MDRSVQATLDILLAEDNPDDVFLLERAFDKAGVRSRLYKVSDGLQAVSYLKGDAPYSDRRSYPFPDVLLLDLNMPCMTGFEVLEWVRKDLHCRRLVVHVLTASSRESDIQRGYDLGANSYVLKPTQLSELISLVAALHEWHGFIRLPPRAAVPSKPATPLPAGRSQTSLGA